MLFSEEVFLSVESEFHHPHWNQYNCWSLKELPSGVGAIIVES